MTDADKIEIEYFENRAAEERQLAETADDQRAADAHSEMAERYESLAEAPPAARRTLHIAVPTDGAAA